jgi:hypothetical protein
MKYKIRHERTLGPVPSHKTKRYKAAALLSNVKCVWNEWTEGIKIYLSSAGGREMVGNAAQVTTNLTPIGGRSIGSVRRVDW